MTTTTTTMTMMTEIWTLCDYVDYNSFCIIHTVAPSVGVMTVRAFGGCPGAWGAVLALT